MSLFRVTTEDLLVQESQRSTNRANRAAATGVINPQLERRATEDAQRLANHRRRNRVS